MNLNKYFGRKVTLPVKNTFSKRQRLSELRAALISLDEATGKKSNYWDPEDLTGDEVNEVYDTLEELIKLFDSAGLKRDEHLKDHEIIKTSTSGTWFKQK